MICFKRGSLVASNRRSTSAVMSSSVVGRGLAAAVDMTISSWKKLARPGNAQPLLNYSPTALLHRRRSAVPVLFQLAVLYAPGSLSPADPGQIRIAEGVLAEPPAFHAA